MKETYDHAETRRRSPQSRMALVRRVSAPCLSSSRERDGSGGKRAGLKESKAHDPTSWRLANKRKHHVPHEFDRVDMDGCVEAQGEVGGGR